MRKLALVTLLSAIGCSPNPASSRSKVDPQGLFRDFYADGKFDDLGHPLNARVTQAEKVCNGTGRATADSWRIDKDDKSGIACSGTLTGGVQTGDLILNAQIRVDSFKSGNVLTLAIDHDGTPDTITITGKGVRSEGAWMSVSLPYHHSSNDPITYSLQTYGNGNIEIDYFEVFPATFQLQLGPGSGEFSDDDEVVIESATPAPLTVRVNDQDFSAELAQLVASGAATVEVGDFRRLTHVKTRDLRAGKPGTVELYVESEDGHARMELRGEAPPCNFEGDPTAPVKVLITGFQPFPADARHENISAVAVTAARMSELPSVQLMRLILPVEYDRAAAEVTSAIARCQPNAVISFGQGGDLNLEETAYNLKDTSDFSGGAPDNRGIIAVGVPIDDSGPSERSTRLPIQEISTALKAIGEEPQFSQDPGRYICNNVFFAETSATETTAIKAGFVHFPYAVDFPEETRLRWGKVVETIVRTVAAQM